MVSDGAMLLIVQMPFGKSSGTRKNAAKSVAAVVSDSAATCVFEHTHAILDSIVG
jgi:hypothetical protein